MKTNDLQMLFGEGLFETAKVLAHKSENGFIVEIAKKNGEPLICGTSRVPEDPRVFKTWSSAATTIKKIGFTHFYLEVNGKLEKMSVDVASTPQKQKTIFEDDVTSTGTKRFNANIPAKLYGAVKVKAAKMDISLNELAVKWMTDWLKSECK